MLIPKRHVASYFELSTEEVLSLQSLVVRAKKFIDEKYSPDGYNFGANVGINAGQTLEHLHIHLIPRYTGDVDDPEGGIRTIIPGKGKYRK